MQNRFTSLRSATKEAGAISDWLVAVSATVLVIGGVVLLTNEEPRTEIGSQIGAFFGFSLEEQDESGTPAVEVEETASILELREVVDGINALSEEVEDLDAPLEYTLTSVSAQDEYQALGLNGEEPTFANYCFSITMEGESAFYNSSSDTYENGDAGTVYECTGWS